MERLGDPLVFPADPGEGRRARRAIRELAAKAIPEGTLLDDVELMGAEAIANAILHGSGLIRAAVSTDGRRLRVEVGDDGPAPGDLQGRRRVDHGRGLTVIDALADEWELDQTPRRTLLWFEVDTTADVTADAAR
ncbi:ATP-binding protein [Actinomadura rubrisoli]|uniref:ATP-binding protein n=2 Tax=Actinomadura rubrisoli TaxID=2530368 RepID=A0A4R5BY33_9ACTN|nr:ATP-binding protein [Actinomadura rubrisoli]